MIGTKRSTSRNRLTILRVSSVFGRGIWSKSESVNTSDNRFHNKEAVSMWSNSTLDGLYVTPIMHHSTGPSKKLMMDLHSVSSLYGPMIDNMMACSDHRRLVQDLTIQCASITPSIMNNTSWIQPIENGPGASMLMLVYPVNDTFIPVGFIGTGNRDCLGRSPMRGLCVACQWCGYNETLTWSVRNGEAKLHDCGKHDLAGHGDHHNPKVLGFCGPHPRRTVFNKRPFSAP
mmetsp:Transcript_8117/g.17176  ORF Transcript_8117/g.17176 Transcript_8117/m.17176 type:complete len:231 (-) Transcript_8117:545-1237(-)